MNYDSDDDSPIYIDILLKTSEYIVEQLFDDKDAKLSREYIEILDAEYSSSSQQ